MNPRRILSQSILTLLALGASPVSAANLTWDANAAALPNPVDGAQTWDLTNARFWNGTANVLWTNSTDDIAFFGTGGALFRGIPGAVTVAGALTTGGLDFETYVGNGTKYNITGGTSLTLGGANPTITMNTDYTRPFAAINTVLAGTAGITVAGNGNGILEFGTQANTFTGGLRLQTGALSIASDSGLGGAGNGLTFTGNAALIARASFTAAGARNITINNGVTAAFDALNGATLTVAGVIGQSGTGSLQKNGLGGLTLINANTYTGETRVRQGTLTLDFSNAAAPLSNIINAGSTLRLFGGTLTTTGRASTINTQTFNGLTLDPGASGLTATAGAGGSTTINLGAISRNAGATLNVAPIAADTSYTTTTGATNGLLGGYATVNNADWVTVTGGSLAAFTGYQTSNDPGAWLASDNVSLAGSPLTGLGTTTINSLKVTADSAIVIGAPNTLTLGSGGLLVTGGAANISGGTLRGAAGADLVVHQHNAVNPTTIFAAITNNGGATGLTKTGAGTLVLSGPNSYSGGTFLNAGILDVTSDAALGTGTTVTARAGTTLRISGSTAFASTKNFQFDFGSDSFGGAALGAGPNSVGNFNVDIANPAGATISGAFNVSAGTFVKSGPGILTLTNSGSNNLGRLNGGLATTINNGGVVFDGGPTSEWRLGQGEFTIGDNTPSAATVVLNSGTFSNGSWTSIGRGNGTGGLESGLTVSGGTFNTGNLFTGFANGVAGYNTRPFINVSNNGVINVSDTFRLSESAGASTTATVSGAGQINTNNNFEITGGRALLNIASPTASVNVNQVLIGTAAGGTGAIWNRGGLTVRGGASITNFALGHALNGYGYYLHDTATPLAVQELGVGGAGGGSGVLEVRSGTVASANWVTINRTDAANETSAMVLVSGGTLQTPNIGGRFYANQVAGAALYTVIDVGTGGRIDGSANSDINLNNTANAGHQSVLTVHGGGVVEATRIFAGQGTGSVVVNLDGGTLRSEANANLLDNNLDGVVIYGGGATFDTNGFNATVTAANNLSSPTGDGLASISIATLGAGYIGRPIVRITDPTGSGASAVANFDEAMGVLTGITITSPGTGYTAPVVTLVGGGATEVATIGAASLVPNSSAGGLTKNGAGTLTINSTAGTYGGPTVITDGTLAVAGLFDGGSPSSIGASSNAASNLVFDGGGLQFTGGTTSTDRNFTITAGKTATIDVNNIATLLTLTGGSAATTGNLTKTGSGTLALGGTNLHTGITTVNGGVLSASGTYSSGFVVGTGGHLTPQIFAINTLTVPTLTLGAGSAVDFEFGLGNDQIVITTPNGLTLGTTGLFLYQEGGTFPLSTNGTYTLFDYTTGFNGSLTGAFSIANSQIGKVYGITDNTAAGLIELTVADAVTTTWAVDAGGLWTNGANWTAGVPNSIGALANFTTQLSSPATVSVNGPKTLGAMQFDSLASYTIAGAAGDTITLNNGFATPIISVLTGSHTISAPLDLPQSANLSPGFGATLTLSGNISGSGGVTVTDIGTVVLSGTNTYAGTTTINSGTLEVAGGASLGSSSGVVEKNGAVFRVNSAGATTITQPVTFDLAGGTPAGISGQENGLGNFAIEVSPTTLATFSGQINNPSGSLVIRGGGSLTITNPGATVLSNVGGLSTVVQNGTLILDGGAAATYAVTGGELTIGDNTPVVASVTLASGTLNVGTFTSVGRGNGTSSLQSSLNITGGTLNTVNLFTGFANGVGGYNAEPVINVSGNGIVNAATTRLGESFGSISRLNLSGTSTLTNTGDFQLGWGGRGLVTVTDTATLRTAQLGVGYGDNAGGNTGTGILRQTGGVVEQAGAFGGDWRIGGFASVNDSQTYGAYLISGGTLTTNRNFQIGSNGLGVLDISGTGSVTTTGGFPVVGRFAGSQGLLNVSSGSFNQTTAGQFFIIGEEGTGVVNVSGTGALNVAGDPGGPSSGAGTGGIRLGHVAGGSGQLNLNGGSVSATGIAKSALDGSFGEVYLNGGTLRATASNATFMQGLNNAFVGLGGAILDTNGNDITIGQPLLAPTGNGVQAVALLDGGSGYVSQPIVQILGDGFGATAVATVSPAGLVTNITITNPGHDYTTAPTINLLGGGGFGAIIDSALINPTPATGGLTKVGAGTLTLAGTNTYGGATNVNAGTLQFDVSHKLSTLNVAAGATARLTAHTPAGAAGVKALDLSAVTITGTGRLDLTNNAMVVRGGIETAVDALITTGLYGGPNGYWDGPGVQSSGAAADANFLTGLGVVDNALAGYTDFAGVTGLTGPEILVKYTYYGDSDLNGVVNSVDYSLIDTGFGGGLTGWVGGDYDYNDVINSVDYSLIDAAFGGQTGPLAAFGGDGVGINLGGDGAGLDFGGADGGASLAGGGVQAVPEPGTAGLLFAGLLSLLTHRRRKP